MRSWIQRTSVLLAGMSLCATAGCLAGARVELAAAESIGSLADGLETAVAEYHEEVETADDNRESALVSALVDRLKKDIADEQAVSAHRQQFVAAMSKVRHDRSVERQRYDAARDHIAALRETAAGLQRIAIESISLQDEVRRYLLDLVDPQSQAPAASLAPQS